MQKLLLLLCLLLCMQTQAQDTLRKETKYDTRTKTGKVTVKFPGGKWVAEYLDGKLHGKQTYTDTLGRVRSEYHFKNGLKDGPFFETNFYPAGNNYVAGETKSIGYYKNGLKHGTFRHYQNNTLLSEYEAVSDSPQGPYTVYDAKGAVKEKGVNHGNSKRIRVFENDLTCEQYHNLNIHWERCYNAKKQLVRESLFDTITDFPDIVYMYDHRLLQTTWWENNKKVKQEKYHYPKKIVYTWNTNGKLASCDTILVVDEKGIPVKPGEKPPYEFVDEPAVFGSEQEDMPKYFAKNMVYPAEAKEQGIEGKVYVYLTVDVDGSVNDVKLAKGRNVLLDKEALRLVKAMPKWKPGKLKGKVVATRVVVPVRFQLK